MAVEFRNSFWVPVEFRCFIRFGNTYLVLFWFAIYYPWIILIAFSVLIISTLNRLCHLFPLVFVVFFSYLGSLLGVFNPIINENPKIYNDAQYTEYKIMKMQTITENKETTRIKLTTWELRQAQKLTIRRKRYLLLVQKL